MVVLFLDHDGVICLQSQWGRRLKKGTTFDPFCVKAVKVLNSIIQETNCEIVVSSDWRLYTDIQGMCDVYEQQGIVKTPLDYTPVLDIPNCTQERLRVLEIQQWLKTHPEVTRWVAVDDMNLYSVGNFVHTPRPTEGIKQTGVKQSLLKYLIQ